MHHEEIRDKFGQYSTSFIGLAPWRGKIKKSELKFNNLRQEIETNGKG